MINKEPSTKDIGNLGETVVADYLTDLGFSILDRNFSRKSGEVDVIAQKGNTIHFVEVKTVSCDDFPKENLGREIYSPATNLHGHKIKKVSRTAQWYVANKKWHGDVQIDGVLVWIRRSDGLALVRYLPQIL
jgi:putative endonuclease